MDDTNKSIHHGLLKIRIDSIYYSLLIATGFVVFLCIFFTPYWETNDDIGMSMAAHGYVIAAEGTPNIIFSNVIWGFIVRAIPEFNGVPGYSIATLAVLVCIGTVLHHSFIRLGLGIIGSFSAMLIILIRPVLFPQFTINAGLLALCAILCWHLFGRSNNWRWLLTGCVLALTGYLIRSLECILVLLIAAPMLPWSRLLKKSGIMAISALVLSMTLASFIDSQMYKGNEWNDFNELNTAKMPFIDYQKHRYLLNHVETAEKHGYSSNDINLLRYWFFVDPAIANPDALNALSQELGTKPLLEYSQDDISKGFVAFLHPNIFFITVLAIFLLILKPGWPSIFCWGICFAAVILMGLTGRPGIIRVYLPLVSLLLLSPLLTKITESGRKRIMVIAITISAFFSSIHVSSQSKTFHISARKAQEGLKSFPKTSIIIWGSSFPYEQIYPVLGASPEANSYKHYSLAAFTKAPFSWAYSEDQNGRNMINQLLTNTGIMIVAKEHMIQHLEIYCQEHFKKQLETLSNKEYGDIRVHRLRCN